MADINIGNAPPNSAILPFYATGALSFLILCLLLFFSADSLSVHYFNPQSLTIVHTAALGWGTMIIFGAAHQLLPVVCERDLFSPKIASLCWYSLTLGIVLLTTSFWYSSYNWTTIIGAILINLSAIAYLVNSIFTSRVCKKYSAVRMFVVTSSIWFLFTAFVGLLLVINLAFPFFQKNHLEILKLHAHAGLAGWFLQLVTGISSKLVPMFLLGKYTKEKFLNISCILQNLGLILFLVDGYLFGLNPNRTILYTVIVLSGIVFWMVFLQKNYKERIRKKIDVQMKHTFVSFVFLGISVLLIPVILYFTNIQWANLYGTLLFMGWITGIILGKTFKTLPFIVWNGHYKNLSGKIKVPLPKHLYNEKIVEWQFWVYIAAVVVLAIGIILKNALVIKFASLIWIAVASLYIFNVLKTLLHKTKTQ
ncbi:MAG: hypothetical protein IT232_08375 [Flavobacteriales bacterium]|nr:hypothetical protein [Flavobacteriales bacterium]